MTEVLGRVLTAPKIQYGGRVRNPPRLSAILPCRWFPFDFRRKLSLHLIKVYGICEGNSFIPASKFVHGLSHVLLLNETATKLPFGNSFIHRSDRAVRRRWILLERSLSNYNVYRTMLACPLLVNRASASMPRVLNKWNRCLNFSKRLTMVCNWLWSFFRARHLSTLK